MKFTDKLYSFMAGRYGGDGLNAFMMILALAVSFAGVFIRNTVASLIIYAVCTVLFVLVILRMLSKKIIQRRKENAVFMKIWKPVSEFFVRQYNRIRYIKKYRYRKCPHCKVFLRLPNKKGKHSVKCPKCGKEFNVNI